MGCLCHCSLSDTLRIRARANRTAAVSYEFPPGATLSRSRIDRRAFRASVASARHSLKLRCGVVIFRFSLGRSGAPIHLQETQSRSVCRKERFADFAGVDVWRCLDGSRFDQVVGAIAPSAASRAIASPGQADPFLGPAALAESVDVSRDSALIRCRATLGRPRSGRNAFQIPRSESRAW